MTECHRIALEFPGFGGRKIEADFSGGEVSSDGGVLLIRQLDRWIGLTKRLGELLPDGRDPKRITHFLETLLQQRIYGLALGYEDLNDHDALRHDPLWQTAAERDEPLSSSSTLLLVGKPRRAPGSLADAPGALRAICGQLRGASRGVNPGF